MVIGLGVAPAGCHLGEIARSAGSAETLLSDAIQTLTTQSEAWQTTLKGLENQLVADGQSTIAHEVSDLLGHGVGIVGGQFSCRLDFIGVRMKQGLEAILAKLKGQPAPPKLPGLCNTVPESIDLVLEPQRRETLTFYGYDFDAPGVVVALQSNDPTKRQQPGGGSDALPNNLISRQPYTLAVTLTSLKLSDQNKQIVAWDGMKRVGSVNITYVPCGAQNQRCCKWEAAPCSGSLACDGQACHPPAPVQCGNHGDPVCTSGAQCIPGLANIEGRCMHVAETDYTEDNCKNNVVTWKTLTGTIDITKGDTKSFYVPTGAEHGWVCPGDDLHGNTTCPGDTNYLTVRRLPASQGDEMQIHCKKVF